MSRTWKDRPRRLSQAEQSLRRHRVPERVRETLTGDQGETPEQMAYNAVLSLRSSADRQRVLLALLDRGLRFWDADGAINQAVAVGLISRSAGGWYVLGRVEESEPDLVLCAPSAPAKQLDLFGGEV